jgi:acyl-CoA reductase-like NAD-dependent aldehyde dehydrogenase
VSGEGRALAVENPATEETVAELRDPSREQLEAAIASAREAALGWGSTPAVERAELLHEVATRIRARTDDLAHAMTLEAASR